MIETTGRRCLDLPATCGGTLHEGVAGNRFEGSGDFGDDWSGHGD